MDLSQDQLKFKGWAAQPIFFSGLQLKKPFAVLAEMAKKENWRPLQDDLRNFLLSFAPQIKAVTYNSTSCGF